MAYRHQYINKFEQFGVINYTLRLIDDEGLMPDVNLPIIINSSELNDEYLESIAVSMISLHTSYYLNSIKVAEQIIVDTVPIEVTPDVTTDISILSADQIVNPEII